MLEEGRASLSFLCLIRVNFSFFDQFSSSWWHSDRIFVLFGKDIFTDDLQVQTFELWHLCKQKVLL